MSAVRLSLSASFLLLGCSTGTTGSLDGGVRASSADASSARDTCHRYIACISATVPATLAAAESAYGTTGNCWTNETESFCGDACARALSQASSTKDPACNYCRNMTDCLDAGLICIADNRCVTRPRMCGEKDFVGNSKGVGTYCRYDGDCPATAPHCALDVDVRLADLRFCTAACGSADGVVDASCGESAACDPDFKLCILDTCRALVCATTDHDCDH